MPDASAISAMATSNPPSDRSCTAVTTFSLINARTKSPVRRPLLASANLAQIHRLAHPALGLAEQHDQLVGRLERDACGVREVVDQSDTADAGGGKDRAAIGLVVERHV